MTLCPECQELRDKWLDYRPTYGRYMPYSKDEARRVRGAIDGYATQAEDYRRLIRTQLAGIRETCQRRHQEGGT